MTDILRKYQKFTRTTAIYPPEKAMEYLTLGLASESGEVAGVIKKHLRDKVSKTFVKAQLEKELGDVLWYVSQLCNEYDLRLEDILAVNIAKLEDRKRRDKLQGNGDDR